MAFTIVASCVNCWACVPLCPNQAIQAGPQHFVIRAERCTECVGDFHAAQCASICPIEGAIIDELGKAVNPPGSLSGVPPERWALAQAEIAAR